jgi:hypothetical protein
MSQAANEIRSLSGLLPESVVRVHVGCGTEITDYTTENWEIVPVPEGTEITVGHSHKDEQIGDVLEIHIGERQIQAIVDEVANITVQIITHGKSPDLEREKLIHTPTEQPVHKCRVTKRVRAFCHVRITEGPNIESKISVPFELIGDGVNTIAGDQDLYVIIVTSDNMKRATGLNEPKKEWQNSRMGLGALVKKDECK